MSIPATGSQDWSANRDLGEFTDEDRNAYKNNPLFLTHQEKGDFTPFYITITICTVFGFALILLNLFLCWCSKHKDYWQDPNTGNRWVLPIWTRTPYKQPPLDLTELEETARRIGPTQVYDTSEAEHHSQYEGDEYLELHKRESDL